MNKLFVIAAVCICAFFLYGAEETGKETKQPDVTTRTQTGYAGERITLRFEEDSNSDGFKWSQLNEVVGKQLTADLSANEIIYPQHLS